MIKAQGGIRKSGILSPWRNPLDPSDRFYRRVLTRAILNSNGTQYATLSEPVVLDGDFEIEWAGTSADMETDQVIVNRELYAKLRINSSGNVQFLPGSGSGWVNHTFVSTARVDDGKIHNVRVSRLGDTYSLFVDNQLELTESIVGANVQLTTLFRRSSAGIEHLVGATEKLKIWKDGDRNTGELVTDLRFDQSDTIYQRDYAVPLGVEIASGQPSVISSSWTSLGGGAYEVSATDYHSILWSGGEAGKTYLVSCYQYDIAGGGLTPSGAGLPDDWVFGTQDRIRRWLVTLGSDGYIGFKTSNSGAYKIKDISIKEWSGAILENTLPGDWEKISKKSGDDFWLGVESILPIDSIVDGTGWVSSSVEFDNGLIFEDEDNFAGAYYNVGFEYSTTYEVVFQIFDYVSGNLQVGLEGNGSEYFSGDGIFKCDLTSPESGLTRIFFRSRNGQGEGTFKVRPISVLRKLEYAEGAL